MALSKAQVEAIKRAQKQAIAKRAATQRTKISDSEARKASSTMNKRAGGSPSYTLRDSNLLSKSELDALGRQSKANAEKERAIQKQRKFAKGEGRLPIKERVGTKAEYKQLGKEIQTRKQLIAYAKAARAAQAERAKNPKAKKAAPAAKATPVEETKPVAKKSTPAKKTAAAPKPKTPKAPATKKKAAAPKAPKAPKTPAVTPTTPETPKSKSTKPKTQKKSKTPKKPEAPKLQTLEEAKSKAPTPKGPMEGPAKPIRGPLVDQPRFFPGPQTPKAEAPAKPKGKVATKVASAKGAAKSSTVVRAAKVAANTPAAKAIAASKTAKVAKVAGKLGGKVLKIGAAVGAVKEVGQIVSGQTEKDFRRIQALENRIAVAKGQKPKYTRTGSNPNLVESLKVDAGNALSFVGLGKSRKARLEELKQTLKKVEKKAANKPAVKPAAGKAPVITTPGGKKVGGNTPSKVAIGDKYTVKKGDTLSAIASRSGVSLKEIRAANPKFTTQAKYKGGSMIFSGTTVAIPKKKAK